MVSICHKQHRLLACRAAALMPMLTITVRRGAIANPTPAAVSRPRIPAKGCVPWRTFWGACWRHQRPPPAPAATAAPAPANQSDHQ